MPFVLVLGIFYFIILLPMRRRQQKVQAFLAALKVGDRVVTSGGMFGTITGSESSRCRSRSPNNVRVEVSRNAVVGYQGQEPVAPGESESAMNKNLRWRLITIVAVVAPGVSWAFYPPSDRRSSWGST